MTGWDLQPRSISEIENSELRPELISFRAQSIFGRQPPKIEIINPLLTLGLQMADKFAYEGNKWIGGSRSALQPR